MLWLRPSALDCGLRLAAAVFRAWGVESWVGDAFACGGPMQAQRQTGLKQQSLSGGDD